MLALLYDVHGNLPALEAVLADCPADRFLLGGDYAVAGAWPLETVERLRELEGSDWIRGNTERWLIDRSDAPEPIHPAIDFCAEQLGDALIAELTALPESTAADDVLYCHASPSRIWTASFPAPATGTPSCSWGSRSGGSCSAIPISSSQRTGPAGIELVNPGSVGMPFDRDHRAAYALVHDDGKVELRRVEYDWRASAKAVRDRVGELPARRLEQARMDV